jgi:DNA-binding transcriptional ArsR family regulator
VLDETEPSPDFSGIGALVGEPARARMLTALLEGRALTATELALDGGVAPSTASSHLDKLARAGLVAVARQGRHRYFRIAGPEVAAALEGLMAIAPRAPRPPASGPRDEGLRQARVCYDHLAGEAGVRLLAELRRRGWLRQAGEGLSVTRSGAEWCGRLGIDLDALRAQRRPLCRQCLDWSERSFHLAGALGAAILDRLLALRLAKREPGSRALLFSPRGRAFLESLEPLPLGR